MRAFKPLLGKLALYLGLWGLLVASSARAQDLANGDSLRLVSMNDSGEINDAKRMAGVVISIAKFTEWPESGLAKDVITLGVLGEDEVSPYFTEWQGMNLKHRTLVVKTINSAAEARSVQLLWIASSKRDTMARILRELKGASVLTTSKLEDFVRTGGIIELSELGGELIFKVGNSVAESEQLQISSQVLSKAKYVK